MTTTHIDPLIANALKQAMADTGIPEHQDGKCPRPDCDCMQRMDAWDKRVHELLDLADASPCLDCGLMLPLDAVCYAVDCGGVCAPCGQRRYGDKAEDYRIV